MLIKRNSTVDDLFSARFVCDNDVKSITIELSKRLTEAIEKVYGSHVFEFTSYASLTESVPQYIDSKTRAKSSTTLQKAISSIEVHREHLALSLANLISTYQGVVNPKTRTSNAVAASKAAAEAEVQAKRAMLDSMPSQALTLWAKELGVVTVGKTLPELRAEMLFALSEQEV